MCARASIVVREVHSNLIAPVAAVVEVELVDLGGNSGWIGQVSSHGMVGR